MKCKYCGLDIHVGYDGVRHFHRPTQAGYTWALCEYALEKSVLTTYTRATPWSQEEIIDLILIKYES
jgi:hypothetical protein